MLPLGALRRPLAAAARLARARAHFPDGVTGSLERRNDPAGVQYLMEQQKTSRLLLQKFAVLASLATGPRQNNSIFYEIRTYDIKPSKMKECVEVFNKYIHLRTAHSELVGFWSAELGAMNKVVHIWKYDNFAHRTAVRHALANDKAWQEALLSQLLPLIEKQHNEVAYLVPWCQLGKPPKEGGVYEWVTFQVKPGGPALWHEAFQAAINAHINRGYTKLIGVFHTECGLLNTVHVIWWNESPDHWAVGRRSAHEDARVVAAGQCQILGVPAKYAPDSISVLTTEVNFF